jgi:hypothetical protein
MIRSTKMEDILCLKSLGSCPGAVAWQNGHHVRLHKVFRPLHIAALLSKLYLYIVIECVFKKINASEYIF